MDIKFTIFLYSKYSENSKKFIELFKEVPEDIVFNLKYNSICIDNEKIRKSILNSKEMNIKVVPCILIIYTDGGVQKYEGPDAFIWLDDIITKINMDIQKEQQILYEKQLIEQEKQQIMLEKIKLEEAQARLEEEKMMRYEENENDIEEYEEESHPYHPPPPPPPQPKKKKIHEPAKMKKLPPKSNNQPNNKPNNQPKKTSISELESENEEEAEQNLEKIFETYEDEDMDNKEGEKNKDALSLKKESLMNAAMAMQKSRESQDSDIKKPMMMNMNR